MRAFAQFWHVQKDSGKAFAAAVPRNVMNICAFACHSFQGRSQSFPDRAESISLDRVDRVLDLNSWQFMA
jgi:hypothetical protein